MKDVIQVEEKFYILATSARVDDRTRVLKQGETFAVLDRYGDVTPTGLGELGLYHEDTRFLSRLTLSLGQDRPLLLSSTVKDDNSVLVVDLTNPDVRENGEVALRRGTIHLARETLLWQGSCCERLRITHYGTRPARLTLGLRFAADFRDIFEVRGMARAQRGRLQPPDIVDGEVRLDYEGLDGRTRRTRLTCSPKPSRITEDGLYLDLTLEPHAQATWEITVTCETGGSPAPRLGFGQALHDSSAALEEARRKECSVYTSNEQFNDFFNRASADLSMMLTKTHAGLYPYAGVPWFSTAFGRDGLITALETLWARPEIARGVLAYLAATQAAESDPERDAEPGKILHETRRGEMAALGEVPFGRYYGSVDATPLFVMLAGAYFARTGDRAFIAELWPAVERALSWIEGRGDADGDGFVEYAPGSARGLVHQGWKDSRDAVFHADGEAADPPIALCEVQGYAFAARRRASEIAAELGLKARARELWRQSEVLQERFEAAFWCEELGTYALALDGRKRPCRVRTSNAGHCLYTGIAEPERARRTARTLLADESFCGWGIRTLAAGEARFNPMSYHNGSVWPHDNAIIAQGLARYRLQEESLRVLGGLFDASLFVDLHRLPELFCGFARRAGGGPTLYPVACAPQAWAAGAPFMLLRACLGLTVRANERRVRFRHPLLPAFLDEVTIRGLQVGEASVDLLLTRHLHDVSVNVLARRGDVDVAVIM